MKRGNAVMFVFCKWLRLKLILTVYGDELQSSSERKWEVQEERELQAGVNRLSLNTSLKPVLELTRAVSEDITWEVMELESWNHKDFFFHYSTDHYMRSVEIHSLGRCTSSSQQGWRSSECPMASMVLGSRSPHSACHVLTCFSERLPSSTAFLVRWARARLGAGNPRAGLGYREISPTDHSLLS